MAIFLRPEALSVLGEGEARPNEVLGTVSGTAFFGDRLDVVVEVSEGQSFLVTLPSRARPVAPGERVRLGWQPADAGLYRDGLRA